MLFRKRKNLDNSSELDIPILETIAYAEVKMDKGELEKSRYLLNQADLLYRSRGFDIEIETTLNKSVLRLMSYFP